MGLPLNHLLLVVLAVLLLSVGQILFKIAAASLVFNVSSLHVNLLNWHLWVAALVYIVATLLWLYVLKHVPLNVAYPFVGLAFFVVPILSHYFFGEPLGVNNLVGSGLIFAGIAVSSIR